MQEGKSFRMFWKKLILLDTVYKMAQKGKEEVLPSRTYLEACTCGQEPYNAQEKAYIIGGGGKATPVTGHDEGPIRL
jgi:hypothetical protein